jgi:hypothetical protein
MMGACFERSAVFAADAVRIHLLLLLVLAVPIRCRSLTIEQHHPVGFAPPLLLLQLIRLHHTHPVIGIFYSLVLTDLYVGFE